MSRELKKFVVKTEIQYEIEAENEYHAANKVAKLAKPNDYASATPVKTLVSKTIVVGG
jgi:hypothetical protein